MKIKIINAIQQILNNYFKASYNIMDLSLQKCAAFASNNQQLNIIDVKGDVNIEHLDWSQWANVDTNCAQINSGTEEIRKSLNDLSKKIAGEIKDKIKDISGQDIDVMTEMTNISNTISKVYEQDCILNIENTQEIIVQGVDGDVNISYLKWSQVIDGISSCIQNNTSVKSSINALWKVIGVKPSPKGDKNEFIKNYAFIIAIPFVFLILFVLFPNQHKNPALYGIFFFLLFLYLSLAKIWLGFPYSFLKGSVVNYVQYIMIALCFLTLSFTIISVVI